MISKDNTAKKGFYAFLRGVNVGGINMKMKDVCIMFESAGMAQVSSVLASGNILFTSEKERNELIPLLEKTMSAQFNYEAFLFIKDKDEVATIVNNNPFSADPAFHVYGFAGMNEIEKTLLKEFERAEKSVDEEAQVIRWFLKYQEPFQHLNPIPLF